MGGESFTENMGNMKLDDEQHSETTENGYVDVNGDELPPSSSSSDMVSISVAEKWEKELLEDPKNRLALSALSANDPKAILTQRPSKIAQIQTFNIKIPLEGKPITNQRSSGRCWLFAATNVFRVAVMRKHNIAEFELSQAYLFFWDKLEKANYFLEQILDTVAEPLDGRLVQTLLASPVGDGGQWDMVANLVAKYGLVPQSQYPDSWSASNSTPMDTLVTTKLREDALELRQLVSSKSSQSSVHDAKEKMMRDIHGILTVMLGPPPAPNKEFTWEFTDKDEKFHSLSTTPVKFAQELSTKEGIESNSGSDVKELFSLVNDPRNEYMELLTVSRLGNVIGMRGITYVNVDMATMKKACIAQLRANLPIFFGSDVGKYSDSASGIMDTSMLDYELGFNVKLGMTKAQRLLTHESAMTHAMVLTAVHVEKGKGGDEGSEGGDEERAVRWRVQNSWGDGVGTKGWFVMSDAWMDQFVYQAVVDPRFVSRDVTDVLKKDPIVLPLWDPMGALA